MLKKNNYTTEELKQVMDISLFVEKFVNTHNIICDEYFTIVNKGITYIIIKEYRGVSYIELYNSQPTMEFHHQINCMDGYLGYIIPKKDTQQMLDYGTTRSETLRKIVREVIFNLRFEYGEIEIINVSYGEESSDRLIKVTIQFSIGLEEKSIDFLIQKMYLNETKSVFELSKEDFNLYLNGELQWKIEEENKNVK